MEITVQNIRLYESMYFTGINNHDVIVLVVGNITFDRRIVVSLERDAGGQRRLPEIFLAKRTCGHQAFVCYSWT